MFCSVLHTTPLTESKGVTGFDIHEPKHETKFAVGEEAAGGRSRDPVQSDSGKV